jgi:hypothetical protein
LGIFEEDHAATRLGGANEDSTFWGMTGGRDHGTVSLTLDPRFNRHLGGGTVRSATGLPPCWDPQPGTYTGG